ncbi:MAG: VTT domain-containing protein [Candidatus Omnitrophica bacterium]|nr:VTT domain-containing protein [Candidatus Omnitrophota bacterium]
MKFSLNRAQRHKLGFIVFLLFVLLTWYSARIWRPDTAGLERLLAKLPLYYSGILYIVLYVVVTFFIFFSKDVFWIIGALLFKPFLATVFICIAETINAFILFYLARYLGRGYVSRQVSKKYKTIDRKIGKISLFWLFIFRAAPLIPYRFMDLAAGLTRIRFRKYLIAVIVGSPIKMFWIEYVLYGVGANIIKNPQAIVGYFASNKILLSFSLVYVLLVILVIMKLKKKG